MAEGGDFTSIKDGSDADFDIVCTPCGEGNIREGAVKYCPECKEYLCTACTIYHGRLKTTRSHKLLDSDSAKQGAVVAMTTKCLHHSDRDIEMYCKTHDMVYCLKCIATEHSVYNTSGSLLKIISKDAESSRNVFKSSTQHMAVYGETVIVADNRDGAVCLGRDGTVRRELRDSRLVNTAGVCVSSNGTVFLSGYISNNIVMFDKNGKCLGELVAKEDGLVHPVSLHYDKNVCIF